MGIRLLSILFLYAYGHLKIVTSNEKTSPRPFYLFSHMCNSIKEVDAGLSSGANAIESDVQFGMFGRPLMTFHGLPCDCWRNCLSRTPIAQYLAHVRNRGTPEHSNYDPKLSLLYLDLKLDLVAPGYRYSAGQQLAQMLIVHFFRPGKVDRTQVRLILGFPSTKDEVVIRGFLATVRSSYGYLMRDIGFEVSGREDLSTIRWMFADLQLENVWQGDGVTNCLPSSDFRLRQILVHRDFWQDYMSKAYAWTVDRTANLRNTLRMNVDGIMTNQVAKLVKVLEEPEFAFKYRLATNKDQPWKKIKGIGPIRVSCEQDTCWRDCNSNGDWCWTNVIGCSNDPRICQHNSSCIGACSRRFVSFQNIGNALLKLWFS